MGEFREWLRLWKGFPGALIKGWALLGAGVLLVWLLMR